MKLTEVIYFSHELDMLEAHIHEASKYADKIIVKEAPVYFTGGDKPLVAQENWDRFSSYPNVELMVIPRDMFRMGVLPEDERFPQYKHNTNQTRIYGWDYIVQDTDYVFSMDCDEILNHKKIPLLIDKYLKHDPAYQFLSIKMSLRPQFVDIHNRNVSIYRAHKTGEMYSMDVKHRPRCATEEVFGWHFHNCFLTGQDQRVKNIGHAPAVGYSSLDKVESSEWYDAALGKDEYLFGSTQRSFRFVRDSNVPEFMLKNPTLFPWRFRKSQ